MINRFLLEFKFVFLFFILSSFIFALEPNKKFSFDFKGCIQTDYLFWHGNKHDEFIYGGCLKSIDFTLNGFLINDNVNYFFRFNVTDFIYDDIISEAYFSFSFNKIKIKFGQFFLPLGLEQASPLSDKMFLETSLLNGMGEGKFLGFVFDFYSNNFCFNSAFAVPEFNYSLNKERNLKYILSFRTFINLFRLDDFVFHFGVDYKRIKEDQKGCFPFRSISYRDNPCFKTHSSLLNAYNGVIVTSDIIDLELAFMWKSLFFQTELAFVDIGWRDFDKEIYSSFYFQFSYFLNGVYHKYDNLNGSFLDPSFFPSYGAIELLFKYCFVYMINNGPLLKGYCQTDGKKESILFGLNWIVTQKLKIQLNCVVDEFMYYKSPGFQITGMGFRVQLLF